MAEHKRYPNTTCRVCGTPVYKRPAEIKRSRDGLFCSQVCYGRSTRKEHPCVVCGIPILAGANKKTCSRRCANKHRAGIQYKIGSPKDKVRNHRSLKKRISKQRGTACEQCGFNMYEILHVHHKDRDRNNNELENLQLLCPNCHAKEHFLKNE